MSDLDGDLFMLAKQHRRIVFPVIDQRVVQSAVTRAGIERDVFEAMALDHVDDDVRLPSLLRFFYGLGSWSWLSHAFLRGSLIGLILSVSFCCRQATAGEPLRGLNYGSRRDAGR